MGQVAPLEEVRGHTNLVGKYRLIASLGQGGMATVYLAVVMGTSGFRKLAVVKLLRPEIAVDGEFISMFLDEARLCARLSHPNIVHTYDVGVDKVGHLIAMEYLDGVSHHAAIAKLGRDGGPFKFPLQAKVLLEVLEGLRYAHELKDYDGQLLQIVHRDVTPQNIFITYDGQVKLLDFGIAKTAASSINTATGVIKGKLTYMAPEQARGDAVDARTDLYAVGVMLWEAITGRRRWPAGLPQPALFLRLATGEQPESPDAASHGWPAELDAITLKALAPKPEDRFQTAAEFRDALEKVVRPLDAGSLRDLGAMLAEAFSAGRERMRHVIEAQFRNIDAGGPPSAPHQIPHVASPSMVTGSEMFERPLANIDVEVDEPSRSYAPTARPPTRERPTLFGNRTRIAIAVGGAVIALGAAIAGVKLFSPSAPETEDLTTRAAPSDRPTAAAVPAAPPTVDPTQEVKMREENRGVEVDPSARASTASRRGDPRARPTPPANPRTPTHAAASDPPASPVASTPAPEATSDTPFRTLQTKPKVQLERDNPWP